MIQILLNLEVDSFDNSRVISRDFWLFLIGMTLNLCQTTLQYTPDQILSNIIASESYKRQHIGPAIAAGLSTDCGLSNLAGTTGM